MSTRFWIDVIHKTMAEAAQAGGFCAFSHGTTSALETPQPGARITNAMGAA